MSIKVKKTVVAAVLFCMLCLPLNGTFSALTATNLDVYKKSDIFKAGTGVTAIKENAALLEAYGEGTGVEIALDGLRAVADYVHPIDMNSLSGEMNAVKFAVSSNDVEYIGSVEFVFTDTEDPGNYFSVYIYAPINSEQSIPWGESYVTVRYGGLMRAYDANSPDSLWTGAYGTTVYGSSFYPHHYGGQVVFDFQLDYASKKVYTRGSTYVFGLNDKSMGGDIWKGFTNDTAYMSVIVNNSRPSAGSLYITELFGRNLSGVFEEKDKVAPVISTGKTGVDIMPDAVINTEYKLPVARAFDWYGGALVADISIKSPEGVDVTNLLSGQTFTPAESGIYTVMCRAVNVFGIEAELEYTVTVLPELPKYYISYTTPVQVPQYYEFFYIPQVEARGGSGTLAVTEEFFYNGEKIDVSGARAIFVDKSGHIGHRITVNGYTGEGYTRNFLHTVILPKLKMSLVDIPKYLKVGENILPDYHVLDYTGQSGDAVVTISVGGVTLSSTERKYIFESAGTYTVEYKVQKSEYTDIKKFDIEVIDTGNGTTDAWKAFRGGISTSGGASGTSISFSADAAFGLPYALSTRQMNIAFNIPLFNFASLDITMMSNSADRDYFFRLTARDESTSYLQINGVGEKFTIVGSLNKPTDIRLVFDMQRGRVLQSGLQVCGFIPWMNGGGYIGFSANGVTDESAVRIVQIANQLWRSASLSQGDKAEPIIHTFEPKNQMDTVSVGKMVTAFSAVAYDVLGTCRSVKLTITAPDGTVIYTGGATAAVTFKVDAYGIYSMRYTVTDAVGNNASENYLVRVVDEISPEIVSVEGSIPSSVKVGGTIKIPTIIAIDNYSEEVEVFAFIENTATFRRDVAYVAADYRFDRAGTYRVALYARDAAYNTAVIFYTVEVV